VLSDIEDNSIPLILTDPPYKDEAERLWLWLAAFAQRVLIPGGSLICYFGGARINRMYRILDDAGLVHWWPCAMLHDQSQRLLGKFIIANHKPILWYVKEYRRGRSLVPDVLRPVRDKSEHPWAQGDGGVEQWIEHLTDPEEVILDPFAGTAEWGRIAVEMGRRWIGADVVSGGDETVVA
jgi:DNA modification methylase